jgi:hypothetical protein
MRGFTLVEVLVAGLIMFMVLAAATLSFRGAVVASERATLVTELLAPLPWITPAIRAVLMADPAEEQAGEGEMFGVSYRFHATSVRFGAPPPRFDPDLTDFVEYPPRFRLYDVRLELERGAERRSFIYQELAWLPAVR